MNVGLPELSHAFGWAVTHFLWQGALIGFVAAGVLRLVGRDAVALRYWVACGGLLASLVAFAVTASLAIPSEASAEAVPDVAALAALSAIDIVAALDVLPVPEAEPVGFAGPVALLWTLGVVLMALRLMRGGLWVRRLHRDGAALEVEPDRLEDARRMVAELSRALGVRRRVRVLCSQVVESPLVVGWLRPVILVPTATWSALTVAELRAVLAHELAHVRRHDPIVNAVQALVEALLFFHPVVWWLSRVIRDERELCCDLLAIQASGNARALATGLTRLEALRLSYSQVALAAKSPRGSLMTRIQRILDQRTDMQSLARSRRISAPRTLLLAAFGAVTLGLGVGNAAALPRAASTGSSKLSLEGRDAKADYAIVEARILQAVGAGELSPQTAKETLRALRQTMFVVEEREVVEGYLIEERPVVEGFRIQLQPEVEGHRVKLQLEAKDLPIEEEPIAEDFLIEEEPVIVDFEVVEEPAPAVVEGTEYRVFSGRPLPEEDRTDPNKVVEMERARRKLQNRELEMSRKLNLEMLKLQEQELYRYQKELKETYERAQPERRRAVQEQRKKDQFYMRRDAEGARRELIELSRAKAEEARLMAEKQRAAMQKNLKDQAAKAPQVIGYDLPMPAPVVKGKRAIEQLEKERVNLESRLNELRQAIDREAAKKANSPR